MADFCLDWEVDETYYRHGSGWGLVAPAVFKTVDGRRSRPWQVRFLSLPLFMDSSTA
jgi:hypothetical protein